MRFLFFSFHENMNFELNTVSYGLLTSIVGAAALLSVRNSKSADIHPLLLNTQSDVSRLRHPEESAVYRSRMYPMGTPLCSTFDRSIRTMSDLYKAALDKNGALPFLNTNQDEYVSVYLLFLEKRALITSNRYLMPMLVRKQLQLIKVFVPLQA